MAPLSTAHRRIRENMLVEGERDTRGRSSKMSNDGSDRVTELRKGTMEFDVQSPSPHVSPVSDDQRKLWFSSTRASSLLDDQDDDDEELGAPEPRLERITEGEPASDSAATKQAAKHSANISASTSDEWCENDPGSPLVRFSENISGMATFLCPGALGGSSDDLQAYTGMNYSVPKPLHERSISETDSLQRLASSGPCGSSALFDTQNQNPSPPPTTASGNDVACTDMNLLDFRRVLVSDISMLLGSAQGESWVSTVQKWLVEPQAAADASIGRREIYNRCTLRRGQSQRVRQVWLKWHGKPPAYGKAADTTYKARSFDDISGKSENLTPVDEVENFYDSDPETLVKFRTDPEQLRNQANQKFKPVAIDTNASFGSTGHGDVPPPPKASSRNSAPSFESRFPSSRSLETGSFESYGKEDVTNFNLWDDQQVKHFVQVSPKHEPIQDLSMDKDLTRCFISAFDARSTTYPCLAPRNSQVQKQSASVRPVLV